MTGSMSRRGNCYDNAVMESWFSTVKLELGEHFASCGEAKMELFDYIEVFYNQRRRHSTLGQISPAEFERRRMSPSSLTKPSTKLDQAQIVGAAVSGDNAAGPLAGSRWALVKRPADGGSQSL